MFLQKLFKPKVKPQQLPTPTEIIAPTVDSRVQDMLTVNRVYFIREKKVCKKDVLNFLVDAIGASPMVQQKDLLRKLIFERETLMSTGIGLGVAVPHTRMEGVKAITMGVVICEEGIDDYESLDGKKIQIVIMIVANADQHHGYLKALSSISCKFKDTASRDKLMAAKTPESFYDLLTSEEK